MLTAAARSPFAYVVLAAAIVGGVWADQMRLLRRRTPVVELEPITPVVGTIDMTLEGITMHAVGTVSARPWAG
jgi:hypothetical protein